MVSKKLSKTALSIADQESSTRFVEQTETEKIPEGWKILPIEEICTFSNGHGFTPEDWSTSGIPIIRIQNLNGSRNFNYYAGEPEKKWIVNPGELLFAWAGVKGVSFGPCLWSGSVGLLNQHIYRIRENPGIDKHWLFWALQQVTRKIEEHAHGFKYNLLHVRKADIANQLVLVPPLHEQKQIVDILSSVDEAIASTQAVIDQTRKVKQGLLQQLLTRGIGHTKFKESAIEEIPECWEVKTFKEISKVVRGGSPRPAGDLRYFNGDFIPWITVKEVTRDESVYLQCTETCLTEEGAKQSRLLQKETLILTNSGATLGVPKILKVKGCANDGIAAFLNVNDKTDIYFLYYYLFSLTQYFREELAPGLGQPNLNTDLIGNVALPLPPVDEQKKIASILLQLDQMLAVERVELQRKQTIKRGLMQDLLTGKVRVGCTS